MTKFLTAVSALALGLAMSSAALADDVSDNDDSNVAQLNDNLNGNGDNRDNDQSQTNGNAVASGNTVASHNDVDVSDSGNDNSDNSTNTTVGDITVPVNSNNDASNHDNGNNRNNDQSTEVNGNSLLSGNTTELASRNVIAVDNSVDINVEDNAVGIQTLDANVSDVGVSQGAVGLLALAGNDQNTGDVTTGNNAFRGLTGIATVSQDTSVGGIGQAATQVNANASLNFQ